MYTKNVVRVLFTGIFFAVFFVANVSVADNFSGICNDVDVFGWGWDGEKSCRIYGCVDPDGDGWGWDGSRSCRIDDVSSKCVDIDGDGWGWDGSRSCRTSGTSNNNDNNTAECVDIDGDGWGWDGSRSCRMVVTTGDNKNILAVDFSDSFTVEETGDISRSNSKDFWVNSGAFLISENGKGRTLFGSLPGGSKWQERYANASEATVKEADGGYRPQNIFRLITQSKWLNLEQEAFYNIYKYNLSSSFYRKASNAILLFSRYQDGDNLYYAGLRVDGAMVVKKKYKGKYYELGYTKILNGTYDIKNRPNLIATNKWIGIKSVVKTLPGNKVEIKVFVNFNRNANGWQEILKVVDDGKKYGGAAILKEGHAGIRTDFMDVEFDDYKIKKL